MTYPHSDDEGGLSRYCEENPVDQLSDVDLKREAVYWRLVLAFEYPLDQSPNEVRKNAGNKKITGAGIAIAVASVPVSFIAWPIGLPVALIGLGITSYSAIVGHKDRKEAGKKRGIHSRVVTRREELLNEIISR